MESKTTNLKIKYKQINYTNYKDERCVMKKLVVTLLFFVLLVMLSGCGIIDIFIPEKPSQQQMVQNSLPNEHSPSEKVEDEPIINEQDIGELFETEQPDFKTTEIFERYFNQNRYTITLDWNVFVVPLTVGRYDDYTYIQAEFEGEQFLLVDDGEKKYVAIQSIERYVEIPDDIFNEFNPLSIINTSLEEGQLIQKDNMMFEGEFYDYEQTTDLNTQKLLFDDEGLRYIIVQDEQQTIAEFEVLSIDTNVDTDKFEMKNQYAEGSAIDLMMFADLF